MNLKVVIHKETEGYWAEVPALKGCFTQGKTIDEIKKNIKEAIEGWFLVDLPSVSFPFYLS
jgi:predicted RNase H-like HicB family nuclease